MYGLIYQQLYLQVHSRHASYKLILSSTSQDYVRLRFAIGQVTVKEQKTRKLPFSVGQFINPIDLCVFDADCCMD